MRRYVLTFATVVGLFTLAVLIYPRECDESSMRARREQALVHNLATMRRAIIAFERDKGRYPQELEELVPEYVRAVPRDPVSQERRWGIRGSNGVADVHSLASGRTCSGIAYGKL